MSFEATVQDGMDSKIVDLDYLMVFYEQEYNSGKADEKFQLADAAVICSILKEARKQDEAPGSIYLRGSADNSPRGRTIGNGRDRL